MPRAPEELTITFAPADRRRLMAACRALGTSYVEFITFATMQAVTECEGYARDQEAIDSFYGRNHA